MISVVFLLLAQIRAINLNNCIGIIDGTLNGVPIQQCTSCMEGYKHDPVNLHCDQCDEDNGYFRDESTSKFTCKKYTCSEGVNHCKKCQDALTCSECDEGYTISVRVECLKCATGYEQDMSSREFTCVKITCTDGERHCSTCSKDGVNCLMCDNGYKSSSSTVKVCDSCDTDYIRENNGNDFTCTPTCDVDKCVECYSPNDCVKCIDGYKPYDDSSHKRKCRVDCTGKIERCKECSTTEDGTFICYKCEDGFVLIDDTRCVPLPYGCNEGDPNSNTCNKCSLGYYLLSGSCHPCPEDLHCAQCKFNEGTTDLECENYCDQGRYLKDGKCLICPNLPNCISCGLIDSSDEPVCKMCDKGYKINENNECIPCPENFDYCQEFQICKNGFFLKDDKCILCSIDNCNACGIEKNTQSVICETCFGGYMLSNDKKSCIPCPINNCASCSKGQCINCEDGYYAKGGDCFPCPLDKHCKSCYYDSLYNLKVYCYDCLEGYYYDKGTCIACSKDCLKGYPTIDDFICLECNEFSTIQNSKCIAKPCNTEGMSGCSECRTDEKIKECISCEDPNYEIAEDKLSCKPKLCDASLIEHCESCRIDGEKKICTQCSNDYELVEGTGICIKRTYQVCIDFSSIPNDYSFGYTSQEKYENDDMHDLDNGKNQVTFNIPFSISLFLTKSPSCEEKKLLNNYDSKSTSDECTIFTLQDIPDECKNSKDQPPNIMTPKPTPIQKPSINLAESSTVTTINDETELNDKLISEFQKLDKQADADVKIVKISSEIELNFNSDLSGDHFIRITDNNGKINYNGGNLGLALDDKTVDLTINDNENSKIRLFGNGEINLKLSNVDDPEQKVPIDFKEKSIINGEIKINVPSNVDSLNIDSIDLSSNGEIIVKNEDKDDVQINVNNIEVVALTNSNLKNMIIKNSLKIVQSATINFESATFDKNAKVEYQILNYGDWENPIFQGNLNQNPKNIILKKPDGEERPQKDKSYTLISGNFENIKCNDWIGSIDYSNSGFNHAECIPKTNGKLLQSNNQDLVIKAIDNPTKNDGNKKGMIIGIVVGVVAAIAIVAVVVVVVILKKRKDKSSNEGDINQTKNLDI